MQPCGTVIFNLILVWIIPLVLLAVAIPPESKVEIFVRQNMSKAREGIGVAFLHMLVPSLMAFTMPLPWKMERSLAVLENITVHILCLLRVSASIVLFRTYAEHSLCVYFATMFAMMAFVYLKSWDKIHVRDSFWNVCTLINIVAVFIFVITAKPDMQLMHGLVPVLRLVLFAHIAYGEIMYTYLVERLPRPNAQILVAIIAWGSSILSGWFYRQLSLSWNFDAFAASNAFFAIGFAFYFIGIRIQENRRSSDVTARFEEVPSTEDQSDLI